MGINSFSFQLTVDSNLTVEMQYYNASLATWEPLIEPVEVLRDSKPVFVPWELNCRVSLCSAMRLLVFDLGTMPQ